MAGNSDIRAGRAHVELYVKNSALLKGIDSIKSAMAGLVGNVASFGGQVASVAGGILAASGIGKLGSAIADTGKAMVMGNAQMEQYRTSLTVLLGSAEKAETMLGDLRKFAASTPFELPQLVASGQQLLAFGFKAEQIIPMLRDIGDAASASPQGMAQSVESITRAIGQMQAKGKVSAQEMMQLTEAGIPAWDLLSKQIGKTTAQTMKLAEQGKISSAAAIPALLQGMRGKYGGMMEKQSGTFSGLLSTLKDTTGAALAKIGEPLFESLKGGLQRGLAFLDSPAAAAWIETLRSGFATLIDWSNKYTEFMFRMWGVIIPYAVAFWDWLKGAAEGTWSMLTGWAERFGSIVGEIWVNIQATAESVWDAMGSAAEWVGQQWTSLFGESVTESVGGVADAIGNFVESALDYVSLFTTDWGLTWEWIKTTAALKLVELGDSFVWLWDNFTNAMSAAFDAMSARLPFMLGSIKEALLAVVDIAVGVGNAIWEALKAGFSGDWSGIFQAMKDEMGAAMDSAMARVTGPNSQTQQGLAAAAAAWDKKRGEMAGRNYDSPEAQALRGQQAGIVGQMGDARNKARQAREGQKSAGELSDDLLDWFPATVEGWMQDAMPNVEAGPTSPPIDLSGAGKSVAPTGTFSGYALAAMGQGYGPLDKVAKNTEKSNGLLEWLGEILTGIDENTAEGMGVTFQE